MWRRSGGNWNRRLSGVTARLGRHPRWLWIGGGAVLLIIALAYTIAILIDEPIRRSVERQMNDRLKGYSVRLGSADFHPLNFSIDFRNLVVRQDANPDPPVMNIPRLSASVQWRKLLRAKLVGDVEITQPTLHIDLAKLRQEAKDKVPIEERGWQDALQAAYPLTINHLEISNGTVTYIDTGPFEPLRLRRLYVSIDDIRNVKSEEREYPSPVHLETVVFERGRLTLDGRADFLAEPHAGLKGRFTLDGMELGYFKPILHRYHVDVQRGTLSTAGEFEYGPTIATAAVDHVTLTGAQIEYTHTAAAAAVRTEKVATVKTVEATKKVADRPDMQFTVGRVDITDTTVAFRNAAAKPPYRLLFSDARLHLEGLSSQSNAGPARISLRGKFMGTGATEATATFRATPKGPDLTTRIAIEGTALESMNELLRAHGKFDVVQGTFSLYSEITARNGAIDGYVKPLFKDVVAYDPAQDRDKSFVQKLKERLVTGVSKILENRPRSEVATEVKLSGRLDQPHTSYVEVAVKLLQNAFFKAILPGFERTVTGRAPAVERPRAGAPEPDRRGTRAG